jgi:hydrogenase 3 maturation protease
MAKPTGPDWRAGVETAARGAARIGVLGIGNDSRGDDAAGVLCVRDAGKVWAISSEATTSNGRSILLLDGGETPESLTGPLRAFRPDLVILIDAVRGGGPPGTIFRIDPERISDEEVSTHRISLAMLVRYLETSLGTRVFFLGIEPVSTEWNAPLSPPVRTSIQIIGETLTRIL